MLRRDLKDRAESGSAGHAKTIRAPNVMHPLDGAAIGHFIEPVLERNVEGYIAGMARHIVSDVHIESFAVPFDYKLAYLRRDPIGACLAFRYRQVERQVVGIHRRPARVYTPTGWNSTCN